MPESWTGDLIGKMHNHDISQNDLAKEMLCTKSYVSMLLNGARKPAGIQERMESAVDAIIRRRDGGGTAEKGGDFESDTL